MIINKEGKMKLRTFFFLVILAVAISSCERPQLTGMELDKIDIFRDPIQTPISSPEPITLEVKNSRFTLTPLAEYKLSGRVVSRETYSSGWEGTISPIDLAIVWGKLSEPEYDQYMSYSQGNRWYFFKYKPSPPFDQSFVISHSSNNHIIPANRNIRLAAKSIKKKDVVVLEGSLVSLKGIYKGEEVTWNSSLSRTDTGNGSCELFYVTKVRIDTHVYE